MTLLGNSPLVVPIDIVERVRPWVQEGIRRYQLAEEVRYTLSFVLAQGPQGPVPQVVIFFETDSPMLGATPIGHLHPCNTNIGEAEVHAACQGAVTQLMETRSGLLKINGRQP